MDKDKEIDEYLNISRQAKQPNHGMTISRLWLKVGILECYRKGEELILAAELDGSDRFVRIVRHDEALMISKNPLGLHK